MFLETVSPVRSASYHTGALPPPCGLRTAGSAWLLRHLTSFTFVLLVFFFRVPQENQDCQECLELTGLLYVCCFFPLFLVYSVITELNRLCLHVTSFLRLELCGFFSQGHPGKEGPSGTKGNHVGVNDNINQSHHLLDEITHSPSVIMS